MAYLIAGFALVAQTIIFLAHWFLYKTLGRFLNITNPNILLAMKYILGFLSLTFILGMLSSMRFDNFLARAFYNLSVYWLGLLYFFILACFAAWIVYGTSLLFNFNLNLKITAAIFFSVAILLAIYGSFNASHVRLTNISVSLPNLPTAWQGKTALWVSDTHLGQVWGQKLAEDIVKMAEPLHPDIVFIGGDLYDGVASDLDKIARPLAQMHPPKGMYFITGNHEEFSDNAKYLEAVRRLGIKVLNNEMVNIDGLQIIGVDYNDSSDHAKFKSILQQLEIDKAKPSVLLKHAPLSLDIAAGEGISLQLSGHTHQGQVFLFKYITQLVYGGYDFGLKKFKDMQVFTSSGAGTWGPPMRVDTNPEIVLIKFK